MKYLSSIDANDIVRFTGDEAIVSYTAKHCCRLFKASCSASYHREKYKSVVLQAEICRITSEFRDRHGT